MNISSFLLPSENNLKQFRGIREKRVIIYIGDKIIKGETMYIYETKLAKNSPIPKQLDFLRAADQRELLKTNSEKSLYQNLEVGAIGEQFVMDMLRKYGQKHWLAIQNMWMDCQGVYESDILVLTSHTPYVFEVKNYDGLFEYKDHRCFINGNRLIFVSYLTILKNMKR